MPFKYTDETHDIIALDDNKLPIWVHEDGKEVGCNFGGALGTINEITGKNKQYKSQISEYEAKLQEASEKVKKATDIMAKFDEGKLIESGKRDEAIQKAIEAERLAYDTEKTSFKTALTEYKEQINGKDETIYNLMVSQKFGQSEFLNKNTNMTADVAALRFGQNFKIENVDGNLRPVAYDSTGNKIYSLKNPGKIAEFDEAFKTLWDSYEYKNNYLREIQGGAGSTGGHETGSKNSRDIILRGADARNPDLWRKMSEIAKKQGGQVIPIP